MLSTTQAVLMATTITPVRNLRRLSKTTRTGEVTLKTRTMKSYVRIVSDWPEPMRQRSDAFMKTTSAVAALKKRRSEIMSLFNSDI
jgi:hypothetical protein